jgi:hypothetical protein
MIKKTFILVALCSIWFIVGYVIQDYRANPQYAAQVRK